jgi:hypothetical protein
VQGRPAPTFGGSVKFRTLGLDQVTVGDEASFRHVGIYARLRAAVRHAQHRFQVPEAGERASWDRALFLNLTYWSPTAESTVLCDAHITPDVVAHTAWHHLAGKFLSGGDGVARPPSSSALLLGEAIASAFDLYLVGRLISVVPESDFIVSQVPIMAEAAEQAGLSAAGFEALLASVSAEPEGAFEELRALLFDAAVALTACTGAEEAQAVLESYVGRRFEPLLHHFQLSNWVLYARAYAPVAPGSEPDASETAARALDLTLRTTPVSLDWLDRNWLGTSRLHCPR